MDIIVRGTATEHFTPDQVVMTLTFTAQERWGYKTAQVPLAPGTDYRRGVEEIYTAVHAAI